MDRKGRGWEGLSQGALGGTMEGEEKGGPKVPSGRQPVVLAPPTFPSPFIVADEAMQSDLLRDVQRHSHLLGDSR